MKIVVFRYDAEIVTTLFVGYDECRRTRRGFLCGGSVTKMQKNFLPAVPRRGPEAGVLRIEGDFHGWA